MARTRVVVLGGGSGGLELCARLADRDDLDVTLVDRTGAHLWKPRLHEFAAGTVTSTLTEISFYMLAQMRGFRFEQGEVTGIDRSAKTVRLAGTRAAETAGFDNARSLPYDLCVVALGGVTPDFGTQGVAEHAVRLDQKVDADRFRDDFVASMIHSRVSGDPARIAIVGSGATGTELAAHLRLAERAFFERDDGGMRKRLLDITVIEAAPQIMPGAGDELRKGVQERLDQLDVAVEADAKVQFVSAEEVRASDGRSWPSDRTVWAAGLVGHPVLRDLADFQMDAKGRIVVDDRLRSTVDPSIYVIGDAASLTPEGAEQPLPPTAQCASQQAGYLGAALPKTVAGEHPDAFAFKDKGRLISLGRAGSVGQIAWRSRNDLYVHGQFAIAAYRGLQRQHQWSVLGPWRGSVAILADLISPTRGPALKLHG